MVEPQIVAPSDDIFVFKLSAVGCTTRSISEKPQFKRLSCKSQETKKFPKLFASQRGTSVKEWDLRRSMSNPRLTWTNKIKLVRSVNIWHLVVGRNVRHTMQYSVKCTFFMYVRLRSSRYENEELSFCIVFNSSIEWENVLSKMISPSTGTISSVRSIWKKHILLLSHYF
jgi:hypothetical protein